MPHSVSRPGSSPRASSSRRACGASRPEPRLHAFVTVTADRGARPGRGPAERRAAGEDALGCSTASADRAQGLLPDRRACARPAARDPRGLRPALRRHRRRPAAQPAGAVLLGKPNMDEFAMGSLHRELARSARRAIPWDLDRVPGGSSRRLGGGGGGRAWRRARSAPTPAARSASRPRSAASSGSSRPTGACRRYGLIAFASSLDQVGPFARPCATRRCCSSVIAGHDPRDSTSLDRPGAATTLRALDAASRGLRVGVPREYFVRRASTPRSRRAVRRRDRAARRERGADASRCRCRTPTYALADYYLIAPPRRSSNLARYDGVRYGLRRRAADDLRRRCTSQTRGAGLRPRGEAAHHARHLRALAPATTTPTTGRRSKVRTPDPPRTSSRPSSVSTCC